MVNSEKGDDSKFISKTLSLSGGKDIYLIGMKLLRVGTIGEFQELQCKGFFGRELSEKECGKLGQPRG